MTTAAVMQMQEQISTNRTIVSIYIEDAMELLFNLKMMKANVRNNFKKLDKKEYKAKYQDYKDISSEVEIGITVADMQEAKIVVVGLTTSMLHMLKEFLHHHIKLMQNLGKEIEQQDISAADRYKKIDPIAPLKNILLQISHLC